MLDEVYEGFDDSDFDREVDKRASDQQAAADRVTALLATTLRERVALRATFEGSEE